jgi:hypothetical protein
VIATLGLSLGSESIFANNSSNSALGDPTARLLVSILMAGMRGGITSIPPTRTCSSPEAAPKPGMRSRKAALIISSAAPDLPAATAAADLRALNQLIGKLRRRRNCRPTTRAGRSTHGQHGNDGNEPMHASHDESSPRYLVRLQTSQVGSLRYAWRQKIAYALDVHTSTKSDDASIVTFGRMATKAGMPPPLVPFGSQYSFSSLNRN